ncbi:transposase [Rhizobium leguminosarum]|uniref:transposase n=1 Tax=Rhizobium leguminosarum TaxID=384 RepID=UPI0028C4556A|nr:transposase [Rhizobium leguminosarum]
MSAPALIPVTMSNFGLVPAFAHPARIPAPKAPLLPPPDMRVEILGQERRRRWSNEDKLAIVTAVGEAGATITEVARRHDVTRQQIYTWRSELKKKGLLSTSGNAVFIPVGLSAAQLKAERSAAE